MRLLFIWTMLAMGMLVVYPCRGVAQRLTGKHAGASAVARVKALPEVKQFLETAKKFNPMVMLDSEPGADLKYYWIKVGISKGDQFRTNFDFYVDPNTSRILYLDTYTDDAEPKLITLEQWREWRKTPQWKKPHHYKAGRFVLR